MVGISYGLCLLFMVAHFGMLFIYDFDVGVLRLDDFGVFWGCLRVFLMAFTFSRQFRGG